MQNKTNSTNLNFTKTLCSTKKKMNKSRQFAHAAVRHHCEHTSNIAVFTKARHKYKPRRVVNSNNNTILNSQQGRQYSSSATTSSSVKSNASTTHTNSNTPDVCIIGAGPGGLASAAILASKGLKVTVVEKAAHVGGRLSSHQVGHTKFDFGPTLLAMKFFLDQIFIDAGNKRSEDYLHFYKLEPMYRLSYSNDRHIDAYSQDHEDKMMSEFARVFPQEVAGFKQFMKEEAVRYKKTIPLMQQIFQNYGSFFTMDAIKALPYAVRL